MKARCGRSARRAARGHSQLRWRRPWRSFYPFAPPRFRWAPRERRGAGGGERGAQRKRGGAKGYLSVLGRNENRHCQSGAGDFPGEVGNGQAGDVTKRDLPRTGDAREFFYDDEEGQEGDGAVRYRVTDLAGRYELPFAVSNTWNEFVEICDQFRGWFSGHRECWEMPHS